MADAAAAAALHAESELELFLTQIKLPQHTAVLLERESGELGSVLFSAVSAFFGFHLGKCDQGR